VDMRGVVDDDDDDDDDSNEVDIVGALALPLYAFAFWRVFEAAAWNTSDDEGEEEAVAWWRLTFERRNRINLSISDGWQRQWYENGSMAG